MDLKNQGKNPPKQESLVFLEMTVHWVGETAENQRKTREKTKVAENQVFWLDFCTKKKVCAYPLRIAPVKQFTRWNKELRTGTPAFKAIKAKDSSRR